MSKPHYWPRMILSDQEIYSTTFDRQEFEACLDRLQWLAEVNHFDHADLWVDAINQLTSDPEVRQVLIEWCGNHGCIESEE